MINLENINDIMDGCAFLEYLGDYYEYIGMENGKCVFQSISSDYYIKVRFEYILNSKQYNIAY